MSEVSTPALPPELRFEEGTPPKRLMVQIGDGSARICLEKTPGKWSPIGDMNLDIYQLQLSKGLSGDGPKNFIIGFDLKNLLTPDIGMTSFFMDATSPEAKHLIWAVTQTPPDG
jgi:hypothetical protein